MCLRAFIPCVCYFSTHQQQVKAVSDAQTALILYPSLQADDALLLPLFAPVYMCELPETPAAVTAANTAAAQLASLPSVPQQHTHSPSIRPSPGPQSQPIPAGTEVAQSPQQQQPLQQVSPQASIPHHHSSQQPQPQTQMLQHHRQQLSDALQQLHAYAVASLRPGASRHAAAIASIQVCVCVWKVCE